MTKYFTNYKKGIGRSISVYRYRAKKGFAKPPSTSKRCIYYFDESFKIKEEQTKNWNKQ